MFKIMLSLFSVFVLANGSDFNRAQLNAEDNTGFFDSAKAKYLDVKKLASDQIEKTFEKTKDSVNESIEDHLSDLEIMLPYIYRLGYEVEMLQLEITLPPRVHVYLNMHTLVDIKEQEEIIEYCQFQGLSTTILELIVDTSKIQRKIKIGNYNFKQMVIELGLIPTVNLKFTPKKEIVEAE